MRKVQFPAWFQPFTRSAAFKSVYGGRTASKTRTVAQYLILQAINRKIRVACVRDFRVSLDQSVKITLVWAINHIGLSELFSVQHTRILCRATGSEFFFSGLERNVDSVRGWEGVTHVWVDEAHMISAAAAEVLMPTVMRGDIAVEMWFTWNPKYRTDWIWVRTVVNPQPGDIIQKISWRDNPWFNEQSNILRLTDKQMNPERYPHIWEGEPDDVSAARKVLPYWLLQLCVDAWEHRPVRGAFRTAGLDVADTGADYNALALRAGPELSDIDTWQGSDTFTTADTARRAKLRAAEYGARRFYYDAVGVGAGVRGPIREGGLPFRLEGCRAGAAVQAPEVPFTRGANPVTNKEYFHNWYAQASWAVRLRAEWTHRMMSGDSGVDPHNCLFINPAMKNLAGILPILAQPEWGDKSGKLKVDKQPREAGEREPPSPDEYDAVALAFSYDCRNGLRELPPTSGRGYENREQAD